VTRCEGHAPGTSAAPAPALSAAKRTSSLEDSDHVRRPYDCILVCCRLLSGAVHPRLIRPCAETTPRGEMGRFVNLRCLIVQAAAS
jgi:hypothetical protein